MSPFGEYGGPEDDKGIVNGLSGSNVANDFQAVHRNIMPARHLLALG